MSLQNNGFEHSAEKDRSDLGDDYSYSVKSSFSIKRLLLLISVDIRSNYSYLALSLMIPLLIILLFGYGVAAHELLNIMVLAMMYFIWLGGMLFTNNVLQDTHSKNGHFTWVMMPANNLEKFISRHLISSVIYLAFSILAFSLMYLIISPLLNQPVNLTTFFNLANLDYEFFVLYLFWHSVFLLGAAVFKKSAWIKTPVIVLILIVLLVYIFSQFIDEQALRALADYAVELKDDEHYQGTYLFDLQILDKIHWILVGLTPLFWIATYLRISRLQAKHAF